MKRYLRSASVVLLSLECIVSGAVGMAWAATIHLSGTVTDENGRPVAAAEVSLVGHAGLKTFSGADGRFELIGDDAMPVRKTTGNRHRFRLSGHSTVDIILYDVRGRVVRKLESVPAEYGAEVHRMADGIAPGLCLMTICVRGTEIMRRQFIAGSCRGFSSSLMLPSMGTGAVRAVCTGDASAFNDILTVSAEGLQTVRRAVAGREESDIVIKLMPVGIGYVTPGIPVYTEKGGTGDVTTYGSVSDPEFSQGGACNYGTTNVRYYAAINVNQLPGDGNGQWQDGRSCGRCAMVTVHTADGEVRTTVVRIMDKCPDDNCGIDLGGAPAGVIMRNQPGRYAGTWEWVSCEGVDSVSDGPPSLFVKSGSNEWWSLVQVRNGPGGVRSLEVRKSATDAWISVPWATEAENFFSLPDGLLQDSDDWDIRVTWDTGKTGSIQIAGKKLGIAETSYLFEL